MRRNFSKSLCSLLIVPALFEAASARGEWSPAKAPLMTRWATEVSPTNVWPEYPRPQLVREDWLNLNGLWDYAVTPSSAISSGAFRGQILVPFPTESALSGVMKKFDENSLLWYHRKFSVPESWRGRRVRLHFGAVDWQCKVMVNGREVGRHQGGYDAFTFDVTDALAWNGAEEISVCVTDPTESEQPRGKQSRVPGNIFYTATSGIWQTVWLEPVGEMCLDNVRLVPDVKNAGLKISVAVAGLATNLEIEAVASVGGHEVGRVKGLPNTPLFLAVSGPHLWSPEDPFLYDLQLVLRQDGREVDRVKSYFGLREIALKKSDQGVTRITLNGKPIFQIGTLDQGFWPDGLYTAPTDSALRFDLEFLKQSGFNLVRKHVKVEPERWYYWCDKLGLLVWQDMPSGNIVSAPARQEFEIELRRMVEGLFDHPAIVQWVLFNEGWGQYDTERLVGELRKMDPTRLIDNASGWTDMRVGDVIDAHSYPEPPGAEADSERAAVLGEFGGIGYRVENHSWAEKSWGYKNEKELQGLVAWYLHLLKQVWRLHDSAGFSAAVYTQTTDVETECNGLMTYDRAVFKIAPEVLRSANCETPSEEIASVILPDAISGLAQWRYTLQMPSDGWTNPQFDDSSWKTGAAGFGSPGTMGAMVRTLWNTTSIWLRRDFVLTTTELQNPKLEIHHDEDAEVYLNGVLATKQSGYLIDYTKVEISAPARATLHAGTNTIAVHCQQTSGGQYIDVGIVELNPMKSSASP